MTIGKTIALTFVGKVLSLLFNTLPRFVIAFLPRSKDLLYRAPYSDVLETLWETDFESCHQKLHGSS